MGPGRHNRKAVSTSHRTLPEPRLTSKFTISHFIHQFITHFHYNYMSLPVYLSIYPSFYISIYLSIIYPPLHTGCSIFPARSAYLGSVKSLCFVFSNLYLVYNGVEVPEASWSPADDPVESVPGAQVELLDPIQDLGPEDTGVKYCFNLIRITSVTDLITPT